MDLHIHSIYSDGSGSVDEIARKAKERGFKIIAIVDHSIEHPRGLNERKARKRRLEIELAEEKYGIRILDGIECGILENGEIEKPKHDFDIVIASVHSYISRDEFYRRVIKCVRTQDFDILGHLHAKMFYSGRDAERDAEIIDELLENNIALELNSQHHAPPDDFLKMCMNRRVLYSFGSDAHIIDRVGDIAWCVKMAKIYLKRGKPLLDEMHNIDR